MANLFVIAVASYTYTYNPHYNKGCGYIYTVYLQQQDLIPTQLCLYLRYDSTMTERINLGEPNVTTDDEGNEHERYKHFIEVSSSLMNRAAAIAVQEDVTVRAALSGLVSGDYSVE